MVMHIGELIHSKVLEKGISIVDFATRLSCTRVNIYDIFSRKSVDTEMLMRISEILEYDFFAHYSEQLK